MSEIKAALMQLQNWMQLHESVQNISYVVDGYEVTLESTRHGSGGEWTAKGATLEEAILAALNMANEAR